MKWLIPFLLAAGAVTLTSSAALPARLVLLLDGVSYRDVKALQEGIGFKASGNSQSHRQAFHQGYFPASRLISTFPSLTDVAWTEIMGNDPPPGYQRTYFSAAIGSEVSCNPVTSLMEYEKQMTWKLEGAFRRIMSYGSPGRTFKYELNQVIESFLKSSGEATNYYALICSTDTAQHSGGAIQSMLYSLDEKLQELRAIYRAREGKELEILILSDDGNNCAGNGKRIAVKGFLKSTATASGSLLPPRKTSSFPRPESNPGWKSIIRPLKP